MDLLKLLMNFLKDGHSLAPVRIECSVCRTVMFERVDQYMLSPGSQPQILFEVYTDVPPLESRVTTSHRGVSKRMLCNVLMVRSSRGSN